MAELRCPNCGKSNPDFLDVCQFCQTPLNPDSILHIGQTPTKKNTGELESVLPAWLRDVRQQARESGEGEVPQPKVEKEEPPDFLAGLASQSRDSGEDEIPDWLASINPAADKPAGQPPPASAESDFFAQFNRSEVPPFSEPPQENIPATREEPADVPTSPEEDELSKWFTQASEQPEEIVPMEPEAGHPTESPWAGSLDSPLTSSREPAPKEEEDLSWLHNLEAASKETGELQAPKQGTDWLPSFETPSAPAEASSSQEDMSWLDNLGGIEESPQQALEGSSASGDDLSWLNNLGSTAEPQPFDAAPAQPGAPTPFVSEEDLSWLSTLGGTPASPQAPEAGSGAPSSAQEDLSWLNNLGGTADFLQAEEEAPSAPALPQEDLSWLSNLGAEPGAQFTPPFVESPEQEIPPRQTAPLGEEAIEPPDWLKSAMETPSMPPPGDVSLDWFTNKDQPADQAPAAEARQGQPAEQQPTSEPAPFSDLFATPGEPSSISSQDVDSLFSVEMPDWLSDAEPAAEEPAVRPAQPPPAAGEESLAPVDLPSWVQAMRPVEAVISETATDTQAEPEETQGPLAGLRGVIPGIAIGPSMRPKSISLKLQASSEQQTGAALLEQILGNETSPRPLITSTFIGSQQWLRRVLTGLFLIVLGTVIGLRSQMIPVSADLPPAGDQVSAAVGSIPAGANVLVVIDYEPSLAGEMEAVGGPVLDQLTLISHPSLSFVSTSPNGSALVERLMSNTGIDQSGAQYRNLGFLPGGSAGVLGFVEGPAEIIPAAAVGTFSDYVALILMTDHAESGRVWVEQLYARKQVDPALANRPLIVIASAQAGPLLQPYASSGQIAGMISGLSEAVRYESMNISRPGIARSYWDAFGIALMLAVTLIVLGSLWSLFTGIRARRAESEQG